MSVISYPIPPYQNVPIHSDYFKPSQFFISDITLGTTTIITTSTDVNYVIGQLIRLIIPKSFGSIQLNNQQAYVISLPAANQVELDIDSSSGVNTFINSSATTKAQIMAIGDINTGTINSSGRRSNGTYIPGTFINISPSAGS